MASSRRSRALLVLLSAVALAAGACGGSSGEPKPPPGVSEEQFRARLESAQHPEPANFPAARGRTLQQIADAVKSGPKVGFATSVYTPGRNRLAFGVIDQDNSFLYGNTAVYVGRSPTDKAAGPYLAPADSLIVDPPFRSQNSAQAGSEIAQIYSTQLNLRSAGRYAVLVVVNIDGKLVGAPSELTVTGSNRIPAVGQQAPSIDTDTVASAGGAIQRVETRVPPDDMHDVNLKDVLGKKPVALLFATPALCQSRVCGPVVDVASQLEEKYRDQMQFIHQEVYVDNDISKGLRQPLKQFNLETEPWLFTIDRTGRIAARLEGSFGINEFEQAIKAALR